jgi:hypothetical protein
MLYVLFGEFTGINCVNDLVFVKASGHLKLRLEVFTAVTMKSGVFCDVTPCGSYKN